MNRFFQLLDSRLGLFPVPIQDKKQVHIDAVKRCARDDERRLRIQPNETAGRQCFKPQPDTVRWYAALSHLVLCSNERLNAGPSEVWLALSLFLKRYARAVGQSKV